MADKCPSCNEFYGTPETDGFCTTCFPTCHPEKYLEQAKRTLEKMKGLAKSAEVAAAEEAVRKAPFHQWNNKWNDAHTSASVRECVSEWKAARENTQEDGDDKLCARHNDSCKTAAGRKLRSAIRSGNVDMINLIHEEVVNGLGESLSGETVSFWNEIFSRSGSVTPDLERGIVVRVPSFMLDSVRSFIIDLYSACYYNRGALVIYIKHIAEIACHSPPLSLGGFSIRGFPI